MFSCEYRKDLKHNYLIVTEITESDSIYEKEMFLKNKLKGLLPCHTRIINTQTQYYYEISSKQTFESAFSIREIHFPDLKNLFYKIKMIIDELQKYLLDHNKIIFNPKYIYMELETNQIFFLYYPSQEKEMNENLAELVDYLLEKVNHKDNQAVDFAYWLYDYSKKEEVAIGKIIDYLERQEEVVLLDIIKTEPEICKMVEPIEEIKKQNIIKMFAKHIGLPILMEVILTNFLFQFFILAPKEVLLLFGGYAIVIAIGIILLYHKMKAKPKAQIEINNIIREEMKEEIKEENDYGVTTFFGTNQVEHQKILIGKVKGKEVQVSMSNMPFIIGKVKDSVNFTLNDISISRMHVKFFQKQEISKVFMVDLNSTNGTYKNGMQLEANEEVEIVPEDEIQIGKLKFTYH